MFLIFTKDNCLSSNKAISFLKEDGQIYKEVSSSINFIEKDHLILLEKVSENNLGKFLREKSEYFINNNLSLKNMGNDELRNVINHHFKETASFPIIIQLSYDGRPKNCMIGFSQKILTKWIQDENIKNLFVDINRMFGSEECCYLDKKEKMISTFKKNNASTDDIHLSLNSLYELKRRNNNNMGVNDQEYDELKLLKDDSEKLHKKYEKAIEVINKNQKEPKNLGINNEINNEDLIDHNLPKENEEKEFNFILNEDDNYKQYDDNEINSGNSQLINDFVSDLATDNLILNDENTLLDNELHTDEVTEVLNDPNVKMDSDDEQIFVIDDTNEFIVPENNDKEKDYSFDKNEAKYEEYISVNENSFSDNSTVFKKSNDEINEVKDNDFRNNSINSLEEKENIINDNANESFITIDLSNDNNDLINKSILENSDQQVINIEDPSSVNWLEKYELNDQEISHQKEVDNAK